MNSAFLYLNIADILSIPITRNFTLTALYQNIELFHYPNGQFYHVTLANRFNI